jgi:hypothetical protein
LKGHRPLPFYLSEACRQLTSEYVLFEKHRGPNLP